jgi:hypothetical protein
MRTENDKSCVTCVVVNTAMDVVYSPIVGALVAALELCTLVDVLKVFEFLVLVEVLVCNVELETAVFSLSRTPSSTDQQDISSRKAVRLTGATIAVANIH